MRVVIFLFLISVRVKCIKTECFKNKLVKAEVNYLDKTSLEDLNCGVLENDPNVFQVEYKTCLYYLNYGTFSNLENIRIILLEDICIRGISPEFFVKTPKLERVSLKSNQIKEIPKFVFFASEIKFIDLSYNKIDTIEKYAFADMTTESLNLAYNFLKYIDDTWFENSNIDELSLANNNILRLQSGVFAMVNWLNKLNLNFNNIHVIEDMFGPNAINSLLLAGNVLSDLKFLNSIRVSYLDISFNRISYLDPNHLVRVDELVMEPNPWHCSCLQKFRKDDLQILISQSAIAKHEWNQMFPTCIVSKKHHYQCENRLDEDILEAQDRYFELVDYSKMLTNP